MAIIALQQIITSRKIKVLKTKIKNLLGESLTHLDNEFEKFKRGIIQVKNYLFTFLSNPSVPYDKNASERGVRKIKIKQKVSGCYILCASVESVDHMNNRVGRKLLRFPPIRLIYYTVLFLALYAQELIYHHQVAELE